MFLRQINKRVHTEQKIDKTKKSVIGIFKL